MSFENSYNEVDYFNRLVLVLYLKKEYIGQKLKRPVSNNKVPMINRI